MQTDKKVGGIFIFPGIRYGADCPLLYYAALEYKRRGYEAVNVSYGDIPAGTPLKEYAEAAFLNAKNELGKIDFSAYEEVIFASKSVGTAIALLCEDAIGAKNIKHIMLTPINETLPLMDADRKYKCIVSSEADSYVNSQNLKALCARKKLPLTEFKTLGHRLENGDGAEENVKILEKIVKLY